MNRGCLGKILAHELGHNLGLYHTHENFGGNELVDQSNCNVAGDYICDTAADPNLNGKVGSDCSYTGLDVDSMGNSYKPPVNNIMSYTNDDCRTEFTKEQYDKMVSYMELLEPVFATFDMNIKLENSTSR